MTDPSPDPFDWSADLDPGRVAETVAAMPPQGEEATFAERTAAAAKVTETRELAHLFETDRPEWLRRIRASDPDKISAATYAAYTRLKGQDLAKELIRSEDTTDEELFAALREVTFDRSKLDEIPRPAQLIDGVLIQGGYTVLSGKSQSMKSFTALDWMLCVATGTPWLDRYPVEKPGPGLFVAAEGAAGIQERIRAWEVMHYGGRQIDPGLIHLVNRSVDLGNPQHIRALARLTTETGAAMVALDTLKRCTPGLDENSNTEMSAAMNATCDALREACGATTVFIHHTGHAGERSRGASSIEDDADVVWHMARDGDTDNRILRQPKSKDMAKIDELRVRFQLVGGTQSGVLLQTAGGLLEFLASFSARGATVGQVAAFMHPDDPSARKNVEHARTTLVRLVKRGRAFEAPGAEEAEDRLKRYTANPAAVAEEKALKPGTTRMEDGLW